MTTRSVRARSVLARSVLVAAVTGLATVVSAWTTLPTAEADTGGAAAGFPARGPSPVPLATITGGAEFLAGASRQVRAAAAVAAREIGEVPSAAAAGTPAGCPGPPITGGGGC